MRTAALRSFRIAPLAHLVRSILWFALPLAALTVGCGGGADSSPGVGSGSGSGSSGSSGSQSAPVTGQSAFQSAPAPGAGGSLGLAGGAEAAPSAASNTTNTSTDTSSTPRTVQETDLYALDGNRLYYLNGYRGLMVFDLTQVDQPKLLGRYAIFGTPIQ